MSFHVEEDVGLGLYHSLLVGQRYSTVVKMEPPAFMSCVRGVMSRAHAVSRGEGVGEKGQSGGDRRPHSLMHFLLGLRDFQEPEEERTDSLRAFPSYLWGSKFSRSKCSSLRKIIRYWDEVEGFRHDLI